MSHRKFTTIITNMDNRWPKRRLTFAAEVIVNALQEKKIKKRNFSQTKNQT